MIVLPNNSCRVLCFISIVLPVAECTANAESAATVQQITHGPKNHFFGYVGHGGTIPWNASGQYIVGLRAEFHDRMPKPDDAARIVLIDTHNKFRSDENIPFHLLFDDDSKVCESFGLLQSPPPYEKIPVRITYLIDVDRKVLGVWNDIDVSTHSEDVVSFVVEVLDKAG